MTARRPADPPRARERHLTVLLLQQLYTQPVVGTICQVYAAAFFRPTPRRTLVRPVAHGARPALHGGPSPGAFVPTTVYIGRLLVQIGASPGGAFVSTTVYPCPLLVQSGPGAPGGRRQRSGCEPRLGSRSMLPRRHNSRRTRRTSSLLGRGSARLCHNAAVVCQVSSRRDSTRSSTSAWDTAPGSPRAR